MQMVRPMRRVRLTEPEHFVRPIRRVHVADPSERLDELARAFEIVDTHEDVDNRFGIQPWHGRTADMMDAARDGVAKRLLECWTFFLEARRPAWVIRLDTNRPVVH